MGTSSEMNTNPFILIGVELRFWLGIALRWVSLGTRKMIRRFFALFKR